MTPWISVWEGVAASMAKSHVPQAAVEVAGKAMHLHGGIGYTWYPLTGQGRRGRVAGRRAAAISSTVSSCPAATLITSS